MVVVVEGRLRTQGSGKEESLGFLVSPRGGVGWGELRGKEGPTEGGKRTGTVCDPILTLCLPRKGAS